MGRNKKPVGPKTKFWRPTFEDVKLIETLRSKLGIGEPDVVRLGLRRLAELEGVKYMAAK